MNSVFHDHPTVNPSGDDFFDSFTTSEAYNEKLETLDETESITTQYSKTLKSQISQALLLTFEITPEQLQSVIAIIFSIIKIQQECNCEFKGLEIVASVENEIVFHRKSLQGISILSIDSDGDILLNFTGFKKGFETERHPFGDDVDFEMLIYNFLAR